jgi:ribosomal protein L37AE/L43A
LLERGKLSNPRHMLKKLIQDIDNLEKFYRDKEYRNKLESASYLSSAYFELEKIYEQEEKVKEKLNLPQNCTIRYEKVKCCKDCRHNTHKYYYAYIWDCDSKKLKKKCIGKQLPLPAGNIV